jgi:homocysteine S-methyltransferase
MRTLVIGKVAAGFVLGREVLVFVKPVSLVSHAILEFSVVVSLLLTLRTFRIPDTVRGEYLKVARGSLIRRPRIFIFIIYSRDHYTMAASPLKKWFLPENEGTARNQNGNRILLLDGGVSTHLEDLLAKVTSSTVSSRCDSSANAPTDLAPASSPAFAHRELWSSSLLLGGTTNRSHILQGHVDWIEAGADIITTVTYQCHYETELWPPVLREKENGEETMSQMLEDAIQIAQEAAHDTHTRRKNDNKQRSFVVASLGCYGSALSNGAEYTGAYGEHVTIDRLVHFYQRKLHAVTSSHPDGVAFETIPSHLECQALAQLLPSDDWKDPEHCAWISLACRSGTELNDGTPLQSVLDTLRPIPLSALQAIGFNCCDSAYLPELVRSLLVDMATHGHVRGIVLYPNSGEEWDAAAADWKEGTGCTAADELAMRLMNVTTMVEDTWSELCPNEQPPRLLLGGCCRTRPAAIASLRKKVDAHLALPVAPIHTK